jgi:hypothetical protein
MDRLNFIPARLCWERVKGIGHHFFDTGCDLRNIFRTQEIYTEECNSKIESREGEVDAECVPAIRLYEVF